jgi:hypothetical protein
MSSAEKRERLLEAAVAILAEAPERELNITQLNKALFYLDLISLRDLGEPFTKNAYIALEAGPVVANYPKRLVGALEQAGYAEQTSRDDDAKPVRLNEDFRGIRRLPDELRSSLGRLVSWVCRHTSTSISYHSHDNPGWRISYDAGLGKGRGPEPIDLRIALQQILADDPWTLEPLDQGSAETVVRIDNDRGEPW